MYRKPSISDYYRAVSESFEKRIQQSGDKFILETDTPEIISSLLKTEESFSPVKFDSSKKETMRHRKEMRTVAAHLREDSYRDEGDKEFEHEIIDITIPIIANPTISKIKDYGTSTYTYSWSPEDFEYNIDNISFSIIVKGYQFKYTDQEIINKVAEQKKHIHDWVEWVNKDIQQGLEMLQKNLQSFIESRKQKIKEDKKRAGSLSEKMGISLEE